MRIVNDSKLFGYINWKFGWENIKNYGGEAHGEARQPSGELSSAEMGELGRRGGNVGGLLVLEVPVFELRSLRSRIVWRGGGLLSLKIKCS